jgi:hypothetical protein
MPLIYNPKPYMATYMAYIEYKAKNKDGRKSVFFNMEKNHVWAKKVKNTVCVYAACMHTAY